MQKRQPANKRDLPADDYSNQEVLCTVHINQIDRFLYKTPAQMVLSVAPPLTIPYIP